MIKSMTGYGSGECVGCDKKFTVEIRSVNHRYSDINIKTPRSYAFAEDIMRKTLTRYVNRGKVDVFLSVEGINGDSGEVFVNMDIAGGYYTALEKLRETFGISDKVTLRELSRFSDIFTLQRAEEDIEKITALIGEATEAAARAFTGMREREGEQLFADLSEHTDAMEAMVDTLEVRTPQIVSEYAARLEARIREVLGTVPVDEGRLLNEVAVFADKVNVNEEMIRLRSHIMQMREFLQASEPIGRKMDFLVQEMNREINTVGSKSNDLEVARLVIDIKAIIEKLREQIQNVE
ncbi:MAG: YicC family protein [Ruminococcaceae bacterium]|nr:YicC family protein [Oscillospiraceae bacterium]